MLLMLRKRNKMFRRLVSPTPEPEIQVLNWKTQNKIFVAAAKFKRLLKNYSRNLKTNFQILYSNYMQLIYLIWRNVARCLLIQMAIFEPSYKISQNVKYNVQIKSSFEIWMFVSLLSLVSEIHCATSYLFEVFSWCIVLTC